MYPTIYVSGAVLQEGLKPLLPSGDTSSQIPNSPSMTQYIADSIISALCEVTRNIGIWLLHVSPNITLIICMGSILGMMIGSERCRRWAGVSALATMILSVVRNVV